MTLSLDSSKPFRSPPRQRDLVQAIIDAPRSTLETNWIEWKGDVDLTKQWWQVELARQVLGFANRDPVEAAKWVGGCGYIVFGASPGQLVGTTHIDTAKLEDAISKYVGRSPKAPQWSPHYVEFSDGRQALVVTVEPPADGDPIWTCQKGFQADERTMPRIADDPPKPVRRGGIYVRRKASTETAEPADIEMLTRRACTTGNRISGLSLDTVPDSQGVAIDVTETVTGAWAKAEREAMKPRPPAPRKVSDLDNPSWSAILDMSAHASGLANALSEPRTSEQFQAEVDAYIDKGTSKMPLVLMYRAIERELGRVEVVLTNETKRNLQDVEVELVFDQKGVVAFFYGDLSHQRMPDRPVAFGKGSRLGTVSAFRMPYIPPVSGIRAINSGHIKNDESADITFGAVDLYPLKSETLEPFYLVTHPDHAGKTLTGTWTARAKNMDDTHEGTLQVEIRSLIPTTAELMARRTFDEEDD